MNIEGLSIYSLTNELNSELNGGRITKILQPTRYLFVLKIRQPDRELSLAISTDPGDPRVHLTKESRENPIEPSSLCMLLRKHLTDGRIAAVTQQEGLDRVIHIHVDIRSGQGLIDTKTLTVELAGKNSNLIFSANGIIMDASRRVGFNTSRVRQIVPGIAYVPPPIPLRLNPLYIAASQISDTISACTGLTLSKAMMASMEGIGPLGTAEILFRADLKSSQKTESLSQNDCLSLSAATASFIAPFKSFPAQAFVAVDTDGRLLAVSAFKPTHLVAAQLRTLSSMNEAIAFAATLSAAPKTTIHQETAHRVRTELGKLERKQILLTQELTESHNAEGYRRTADLLMSNLPALKSGLTQVMALDLFADAPNGLVPEISISLDPALSPMENIQRYYKKYSRARRAQELIQKQLEQCKADIHYLESVALSLNDTATNQEIQETIQELREAGYIHMAGHPRPPSKPSAPHKILTPSGASIFVGRNNRQNDIVTFKTAQPRDLWFHTKDIPGSHVVLRAADSAPLVQDIEKAAHLAAWFSKARDSANVPVDYTERRHVKKPAGAKPGFVIYDKQKTLWVTPDSATIAALLQERIKTPSPG